MSKIISHCCPWTHAPCLNSFALGNYSKTHQSADFNGGFSCCTAVMVALAGTWEPLTAPLSHCSYHDHDGPCLGCVVRGVNSGLKYPIMHLEMLSFRHEHHQSFSAFPQSQYWYFFQVFLPRLVTFQSKVGDKFTVSVYWPVSAMCEYSGHSWNTASSPQHSRIADRTARLNRTPWYSNCGSFESWTV